MEKSEDISKINTYGENTPKMNWIDAVANMENFINMLNTYVINDKTIPISEKQKHKEKMYQSLNRMIQG